MTDEQLLELLDGKSAEELTVEEIDLIRARLPQSQPLREALQARLRIEADLANVLGGVDLSVDDILREAPAPQKGDIWLPLLGLGAGLLLVVLAGSAFFNALPDRTGQPEEDAGNRIADDSALSNDGNRADQPRGDDADDGADTGPRVHKVGSLIVATKFPLIIQAEAFTRGTVDIDEIDAGTPESPVIHSGKARGGFVEYDFELPRGGKFQLKLRYASFDSRPLRLTINGAEQGQVAGELTGGILPASQASKTAGLFEFVEGRNTLRLDTTFKFPYLDQLVIDEPPTVAVDPPPVDPPELPVAPVEQTPWQAVVADAAPPAFDEICFDQFDTSVFVPQQDDLRDWFAAVDGQRNRFYTARTQVGECGAFEGLVRLQSPWLEDSALRLALENYNGLQIHFMSGGEGVSLVYYESDRYRWAAYATRRKPGGVQPDSWQLTATDEGRCTRTEIRHGGPFELRHRQGEIIVSRGDIVLLRAPLAMPPEAVYFEGRAAFHGIRLVRTSDFLPQPAARRVVVDVERVADLAWHEQLAEHAKLEETAAGFIRLTADNAPARSWVAAPLPRRGLHEVIFEVEGATPGAGVFLGREQGKPIEVVRFTKNRRDQSLCLMMRGEDELFEYDFGAIDERLVPRAAARQWIRLVFGCGMLRWWMSSDGVHWARPEAAQTNRPGAITHVGLQCVAKAPKCGITLRRITLRELSHLASLAPAELAARAEPPLDNTSPEEWSKKADESLPDDVELGDWRRASAVAALAGGCSHRLGHYLIELLFDDAKTRDLPAEDQLAALDEAALLWDTHSEQNELHYLLERYHRLGADAFSRENRPPFSFIRRSLMTAPLSRAHSFRVGAEGPVRAELIDLVYSEKWTELLSFCRRLQYFEQHHQIPLVEWAEATAARQMPGSLAAGDVSRLEEDWRQPLVEQFSKDAYNLLAELQALLDSDAFEAAARMITSTDPGTLGGIAPGGGDRGLLLSLPAAVRLSVDRYPELARVINEKYGPLAQLRVRQAIEAGNVEAVELAAIQFEATAAAAEANRWLGDRALSSGWFARALSLYRRAEKTGGVVERAALGPRIRLAAAMLGEEVGQPASGTVLLGETQLAASEFESLVAEMLARSSRQAGSDAVAADELHAPPGPGTYQTHLRGKLDEMLGESPKTEVTRHVSRHEVPWVDRQLATIQQGDLLYVSNRFQVAAFDLKSGQRKWQSERPGDKMQRSQDWALTPMQPLIAGSRIYARLLYGSGPKLYCLDKASGKIEWKSDLRNQEYLISDPFLVQHTLVAFTLQRGEQRESILRLVLLDIDSGEMIEQHELARLRDAWWTRRYFAATALVDALVASLGGVTLCCDLQGGIRWIRQQTVLPAEEESSWVTQRFGAPLHDGERLYIAEAGVRTVQCLDAATGALIWSVVRPGVRGIRGRSGKLIIIDTDEGIEALDAVSGKSRWRRPLSSRLDAVLVGDESIVVSHRKDSSARQRRYVTLTWLDPLTGRVQGSAPLEELRNPHPRLAALRAFDGKLWAFFGDGDGEPLRELVEIVRQGD